MVSSQSANETLNWPRALLSYPVRLTLYGLAAFWMCQAMFGVMQTQGIAVAAGENGPIERAQAWMALFASCCLFFAAWQMKVGRTGLILCACMVSYATARECDALFESVFFDDAYKYLVGIPIFVIAVSASWLGRKRLFPESLALMRTPAMTIFAFAGIYICTVCQILDRPGLWEAVGEGIQAEATKTAVEEFAELFGYLLLAFSGIESVALAIASKRSVISSESENQDPISEQWVAKNSDSENSDSIAPANLLPFGPAPSPNSAKTEIAA